MLKPAQTILIFLTLFFIFLVPVRDTDFGWHLRCGQELATLGKLCSANHYTSLLSGFKWNSPSQGYDLLLYVLFRNGGFFGVTIFYALSAALAFTFFAKSLKGDLLINALLTLVGLWFSWSILDIGFRSQVISIYFLVVFLALIRLSQSNKNYLLLLPGISLIWANSHSGFFLGPLVVLILLVQNIYEFCKGRIPLKDLKFSATVTALTAVATLVNPVGLLTYQEVFRHTQVPMNTLIAEWVSPMLWQIFLIISFCVFLVFRLWRKDDKNIFGIILLSFFGILAIMARRNLPLFSIAAVFALSEILNERLSPSSWAAPGSASVKTSADRSDDSVRRPQDDGGRKDAVLRQDPNLTLYLLLTPFILIFAYKNIPKAINYDERTYSLNALVTLPYEGVKFMQGREPGNVFNAYEWGGYLIWKLPKFKMFTDGRMPSWDTSQERALPENWRGKSPYTIYIETLQTQPGWLEVVKAYDTKYIMIQTGVFMDLVLREDPKKYGYKEVFRDGATTIYESFD